MDSFIKKLLYPKYVIMKGIQIDNRAIMFLGINTKLTKEKLYNHNVLEFSNHSSQYYTSNIYKRIYTFKQLLKWYRLLGKKDSKCLEYKSFKWQHIKEKGLLK